MADYSEEFQEIDNKLFQFDGRPYLFEPEYTDEELQELRERAKRQRELLCAGCKLATIHARQCRKSIALGAR